jgi:hypothetical protein
LNEFEIRLGSFWRTTNSVIGISGSGDFEPRWMQGAAGGGQGAIVVTFLV